MNPFRLITFLIPLAAPVLAADSLLLSPEETAAGATTPPGFSVDVIAAEPDIVQPIALAWDHHGRLYIAECRTYGDRSVNYDLTESDRIVVLEDRDSNGSYETRKVFAEGLQRLTGIEIGFGGVWALTSPNMVFIPDTNGDLVPDGPPATKLDGFDLKYTRHTIANGLKWGPDGWLYGRQGIVAVSEIGTPGTPKKDRLSIDTGIWRYHPQTQRVEAWTRGGTNPWGHDWSAEGELFYINTVIGHFWHGIPGAYTKRMFGQHQRRYLYRLIDMHADHWHFDINGSWTDTREEADAEDAFGGGHAHTGLMIYQADKWPEEYRDEVFTLNFHGRRINRESLHREGSGFVAKHAPDFVKFPDRWFRGIDLAQGPDGDAYVLDWSDTGECHDHDGIHRESGRVYRIRYGKPASGPVAPPETFEEIEAWLRHPNVWFARQARLMIQEQQAAGEFAEESAARILDRLVNEGDARIRQRYAEAANVTGYFDCLKENLSDESTAIRIQALHFIRDRLPDYVEYPDDPFSWSPQVEQFAKTGSPRERLAVAAMLPRLAPARQIPVSENLVAHGSDADDHNYPLMVWYGIEPIVATADEKAVTRLLQACRISEIRRFIFRRLAEDYDENRTILSTLILAQPDHAAIHLAGIGDALEGLPKAEPLPNWDSITELAPGAAIVDQLGAVFGDGRSLDSLFAIADNADADPNSRRQAVKHLGPTDYPELKTHLLRWLGDDQLSGTCAQALARYPDDGVGKQIMQRFAYLKPEERAAAIEVIVTRASWSKLLLEQIAQKRLGPEIISTVHARQITQHGDEDLTRLLSEVWGEVNESAADPAAEAMAERLRDLITPEALKQSDLSAGRKLYAERCASCHQLYGSGGLIGPDLTGSGRHVLDYLIENVLYPSAVVPAGFKMSVVKLKDGRTLSGVITASSEKRVSLKTVGSPEPLFLVPSEIESTETLAQSLMPAGLINDLDDTQLRDFFGYLMGDHQAPMKK